ncbi:MAG: VanZ family protein [Candidatus Acidiferrales bacterium]
MQAQTQEQNPRIGWIKSWLPVILWAIVISVFSTHAFTSDDTGRFIIPLLHWLFPYASTQSLKRMHFFIRKSGHFTEYFIFSLLVLRGIRAGRNGIRFAWMAITLLAVASYASLDEFHQRFVAGRTPAVGDVLLDTTGGAIALILLALIFALSRRRRTSTAA